MLSWEDPHPVLHLAPGVGTDVRAWLRQRLATQAEALAGRSLVVDLGAGPLNLLDLRRLAVALREDWRAELVGVRTEAAAIHAFAERELKLPIQVRTSAEPPIAALERPPREEAPALADVPLLARPAGEPAPPWWINGPIRSGRVVRAPGDLVVLGDVHSGARVVAGGHVAVLGQLAGDVEAGDPDNDQAQAWIAQRSGGTVRVAGRLEPAPDAASGGAGGPPNIYRSTEGNVSANPLRPRWLP